MHRRLFLKSVGLMAGTLGAGGALAACGDDPTAGPAQDDGARSVVPEGQPSLNVIHASVETLAGRHQRFAFGLTSAAENVPLKGAEPVVHVRELEGGDISGPYPAQWHEEGGSPLGLYVARIDVPDPGTVEVVVMVDDEYGTAAIQVVAPEDSSVPTPGQAAVSVATPTPADDLGVRRICTNTPPCAMHEVSLDDALAAGRPVALLFATPAYCTSALCAPAVETLDDLRQDGDWGDTAFVHVEIFQDDQSGAVLDAVSAWGLRSEPWFFAIGADGTVVDRVDGPMIGDELRAMVERISTA